MKEFLRAWWPVLLFAFVLFGGLIAFPYAVNPLAANADPAELAKQGQYGDLFGMLASALNASALLLALVVFRSQVAEEEAARDAAKAQIEAAQATEVNLGDQVAATPKRLGDGSVVPQVLQRVSTKRSAREEAALLEARLASCVTGLATATPELEKRIPEKAASEQQRAARNAPKTVLAATVNDLNSGIATVRQVQTRIEACLAEARP